VSYQWHSEWESGWNTIAWDTVWHADGGSQATPAHASDGTVGRALYTTAGDNRRGVGSFVHLNTLNVPVTTDKWFRCDVYTHNNDPIFSDRNHRWILIGGGTDMNEVPSGGETSIDTGWQFRFNPHHDRSTYYQSSNYPEGNNLFPAGGPWLQMYAYVHHANGETWGTHTNNPWGIELFAIESATNTLITVAPNSWMTCAVHVVMNTPGNNDGRIELWVDKHDGQGFRECRPFTDVRFSTADNRNPSIIGHDCIISGGDGGNTVPYNFHVDFQRWAIGSSSALVGTWLDDGGGPDPDPPPPQPPVDDRFIRFNFDTDAQGWQAGNATSSILHVGDTFPTARGTGSLRIERSDSGNWRAESANTARDWSAHSSVLGVYILVPDSAPDGTWEARVEIQNDDFSFTNGSMVSLTKGQWVFVSHDFGTAAITSFQRASVHISGPTIASPTAVYIDEYGQGSLVQAVTGDINNDGVVDSIDLSTLVSAWGTSDASSDLNQDGTVNSIDLSILVSNWS
jgi:hypothetical protein